MNINIEIAKRKNAAIEAARKTGKILLDNFGKKLNIKSKGDRDLATNVDLKAEATITGIIKKRFPADNILAEEKKYKPAKSKFRWIIDPLDGTHNYIRGIEAFGTSIALAYENTIVLGVIYMPVLREFYFAQKGKGAYLNNKKIRVSKKILIQTTMVYDSAFRRLRNKKLLYLGKLADRVFNIRMFGSSIRSLTYLACGKADLIVEFDEKPWDCAAGIILVKEAGGRVTDHNGKHWDISMPDYIASNGRNHNDVLRIFKK
ncbi:MAG: inositol monophosphatase [Endomicrobiales bacterium]|nr:inositol monophosphatase [Endomicrobiales bacterium]